MTEREKVPFQSPDRSGETHHRKVVFTREPPPWKAEGFSSHPVESRVFYREMVFSYPDGREERAISLL